MGVNRIKSEIDIKEGSKKTLWIMEKKLEREDWRKLIIDDAKLKGYSDKTIRSYLFHVGKFIDSNKTPRNFLLDLINSELSDETVRAAGFAVKFYMSILRKRNDDIDEIIKNIPNVKREKRLPTILSRQDIEKMIISTKNINHRLIIQVGYGAGLRVSEIVNLRWEDIDFKRNIIHIKRAKGKKDRIVMLSPKIKKGLIRLDENKDGFVFKTVRGEKYTTRTIQAIIKNSAKKAQINKRVTPHTLRHSFATHLLEKGTDIRYIKDLLGHSDIKTTLIYTKVSNRDISRIKSPLD